MDLTAVDGFDWDDGNWPKCAKQGVSREEIEAIFRTNVVVGLDRYPNAVEQRFNAVGNPASGRMIFVVFTLRIVDGITLIRPISARYMHRKEIARYEQRKEA